MVNMADHKKMVVGDRVIEPGNSENFYTGDWRSSIPDLDKSKCINCLTCWVYCPDSSIIVENGKIQGLKLTHCKGCGICAKVCPKDAIIMRGE